MTAPAPRTHCPVCERPGPLLECGLCNTCSAAEPLRAAFEEGQARLRGDLLNTDEP